MDEEEDALIIVERMLKRQSNGGISSGHFNLNALDVMTSAPGPTAYEKVKSAVQCFGDQVFTVQHVEAALEKMGIKIAGKLPRARIAMMLTKLEEEKIVERTFRGKGSAPHKFKQITALSTAQENI